MCPCVDCHEREGGLLGWLIEFVEADDPFNRSIELELLHPHALLALH